MSYSAKRILSLDNSDSRENLLKLADLFYKETNKEYMLAIYDDHLDDYNWNDGDGISGLCDDEDFYANISSKLGRVPFTVHSFDENDDVYEYKCNNGEVEEIFLGSAFEDFINNQDIDEYIDEDQENELFLAYIEEHAYHIKYGDKEYIPAKGLNDDNFLAIPIMSYYTKRIITIDKDSTREKLEKLADIFDKQRGYKLAIFNDHLDDSNWNTMSGISDFIQEDEWAAVSEEFGNIPFKVHNITEDHAIFDFYCCDGSVQTDDLRNSDAFYEMYKDISKRSPGANQSYYEDPGNGEDYPILYGGHMKVPGGVQWV